MRINAVLEGYGESPSFGCGVDENGKRCCVSDGGELSIL